MIPSEYNNDSIPPNPWQHVTTQQWNDWKWQLTHRLNNVQDFAPIINLTADEIAGLEGPDSYRVDVTPYIASLMDPNDPNCPIRRQIVPTAQELIPYAGGMRDPASEENYSPVPGLVHRHPDWVVMLVTGQCASYCRFCNRSRIVGDDHATFSLRDYERQFNYIAANPQIRDVLLSGGDPLLLPRKILVRILERLQAIEHIESIRIETRVPVFLPQLITEDFAEMLSQFHPLWIHILFNHPKELAPEICAGLNRLANADIPLASHTVLMAGINDCPNIMLDLVHKLVHHRVRPYYLYQCDLAHGVGHFRTPVSKGLEIMESLCGHTSGYAIPTYVINSSDGGSKIPILPNYLINTSDRRVIVGNYEGFISTYIHPESYTPHNPATCLYCQSQNYPAGGVAGLVASE
jgi:lysine 2,3-aminomutase